MIIKTIKIGDVEETFKASAATTIRFKRAFGEDMSEAMTGVSEEHPDIEIVQKIAFAMTDACKNGENFEEWLDKFAFMDFLEAINEIMEVIVSNSKTYQPKAPKKAKATGK